MVADVHVNLKYLLLCICPVLFVKFLHQQFGPFMARLSFYVLIHNSLFYRLRRAIHPGIFSVRCLKFTYELA
jgi:hypothetical protein